MQSELNVEEVVNDRSWKVGNNVGSCRELSEQGAARRDKKCRQTEGGECSLLCGGTTALQATGGFCDSVHLLTLIMGIYNIQSFYCN